MPLVGALKLKSLMSEESAEKIRGLLVGCLTAELELRLADVREVRAVIDDVVAQEGIEVSHFNFALSCTPCFESKPMKRPRSSKPIER